MRSRAKNTAKTYLFWFMAPAICSSDMQGDRIALSTGGKREGEKANVAADETALVFATKGIR